MLILSLSLDKMWVFYDPGGFIKCKLKFKKFFKLWKLKFYFRFMKALKAFLGFTQKQ